MAKDHTLEAPLPYMLERTVARRKFLLQYPRVPYWNHSGITSSLCYMHTNIKREGGGRKRERETERRENTTTTWPVFLTDRSF